MKNLIAEFKEFIARGNAMTMAVGIIVGSAFTSIVTSLVNDIITPFLGIIIGGIDFTSIIVSVGDAQLMVGNFIQAVITFLLTAFVIFMITKALNKLTAKKKEEVVEEPAEPEVPADIQLLTEIRDLLSSKEK